MIPLFSKNSLMILESLSFTKTLYAFDFDGTLSKISSSPGNAKLNETTHALIRKLARSVPVAVISGRSIDDLREKLRTERVFLVGNHGLEGLELRSRTLSDAEKVCQNWKAQLGDSVLGPGVMIEDKHYSLAIHWRNARSRKRAREKIKKEIAKLDPAPRVLSGKAVYNLLPSGAPHKGLALLDLLKKTGTTHAFYVGDDDTDEDVFGMPGATLMTVRVGESRKSKAKYFISRQSQINQLLKTLIKFHKTGRQEK